jgi:hypothetical protein
MREENKLECGKRKQGGDDHTSAFQQKRELVAFRVSCLKTSKTQ